MPVVADTCFIIDWSRFRRRDILVRLFGKIIVTQYIINEIKSDYAIEYVSSLIASDKLYIYPITSSVERVVMDLMSYAIRDPRIPRVDEPELYALALGFILDLPVLTENRGARRLASLHPTLARLEVLGAIEVLEKAIIEGIVDVDECTSIFDEYTIDTKHMFPRKRLNRVLENLRNKGYCR